MAETVTVEDPQEEVIDTTGAPDSISVLDKLFTVVGQPAKQEQKAEKTTEAEVKTPAATQVKLEQQPNLSPKARENFAKLEEAKKAAEERATKAQADYEATQKRIQELEEKLKTAPNPEEFSTKERAYQEQLQKLQGELKFAALERDPDFVAKYETPTTQLHQTLQEMALTTGATQDDFQRAVRLGLSDRLDEIRESLPSHQQRRWDAALTQIESVQLQREIALKDRDRTYEEILQNRQRHWQEQASQQTQKNIQLARQIAEEPFQRIEALKGNDELRGEVQATLEAIAGGNGAEKYTPENIMREFAASVVQRHILQTQHQVIETTNKELSDTKTELEQVKAKLKEHEEFIQKRYGSLPKNEASTSKKQDALDDSKPIWSQIRVRT